MCKPADIAGVGNGRQRAPNKQGRTAPSCRICVERFRQRRHGFDSPRGLHGSAPTPPSHDCRTRLSIGHQRLIRDHLAYCGWRRTVSSVRTISLPNTTPSLLLVWTAASSPFPTLCVQFPNSTLAAGRACTIRRTPSTRVRSPTRTTRSSLPNFYST